MYNYPGQKTLYYKYKVYVHVSVCEQLCKGCCGTPLLRGLHSDKKYQRPSSNLDLRLFHGVSAMLAIDPNHERVLRLPLPYALV